MKTKTTYCFVTLFAVLIFFIIMNCTARAQEIHSYSLEEIYRIALEKSEDVQIADENVEQSKGQVIKARSMLLPKLNLNYSKTHYNKQITLEMPGMEGIAGMSFEIFPQDTYTATTTLIQPIYMGGMQWASYGQAKSFHKLTQLSTAKAKQELLFAISALYFQILKVEAELQITNKSLELAKKQLDVAKALLGAGEVTTTSVLRAELDLTNDERLLIEQQNNLRILKKQLSTLVGLKGDFILERPQALPFPQSELNQLLEIGKRRSFDIQIAEKQLSTAMLEKRKAYSFFQPTVSASVTFLNQSAPFPTKEYLAYGLNVSIPIFDGGLAYGSLKEAKAKEQQAILARSKLLKQLNTDITQAYLDLETLSATLETLEKAVELAEKNYQITTKLFAVGEATSLEVSQALTAFDKAQKDLSNLKYDRYLAILRLQKTIGTFAENYNR
jgi:outer membrane protein TolC